jgi:hypothetical protein
MKTRPFEPFEVVMPNGDAIPVEHPKSMAFSPGYNALCVYSMRGGVRHIDVKLITDVRQTPNRKRRLR